MVKKEIQNDGKAGLAVITGVGLSAMALVAGAYFLYGAKEAGSNRKKVRGWMLKAKGEVLDGVEKLKSIDEAVYNKLIDTVLERYKKVKTINLADIEVLTKELKGHWKNLKKEVSVGNSSGLKSSNTKKSEGKTSTTRKSPAK
jgi:hypothetical protein